MSTTLPWFVSVRYTGGKNLEIKDVLARECELCPYRAELRLQSDSNPSHFQLHTQKPAVQYKISGKGNRKKNEDEADNFGKGQRGEFGRNGRGVENSQAASLGDKVWEVNPFHLEMMYAVQEFISFLWTSHR